MPESSQKSYRYQDPLTTIFDFDPETETEYEVKHRFERIITYMSFGIFLYSLFWTFVFQGIYSCLIRSAAKSQRILETHVMGPDPNPRPRGSCCRRRWNQPVHMQAPQPMPMQHQVIHVAPPTGNMTVVSNSMI